MISATPISVMRVRDVLLVSVPADPDDRTISLLQEHVLTAMQQDPPKGLVLDISTVDTLDSFFARTITETARMVSLMGGRTVIAGMRAPVAISATQLGVSLHDIRATLDVDRALTLLSDAL